MEAIGMAVLGKEASSNGILAQRLWVWILRYGKHGHIGF